MNCASRIFVIIFYCLGASGAPNNEPLEVPTKKDDLEEIQLKSSLEDRLARDLKSYLGASRFIINVDVSLEKIRQVVQQKNNVNTGGNKYNQPTAFPKLKFPSTNKSIDSYSEDLPGLPFVELPGDKEKDAELQFMREQIKRLQNQQSQPRWDDGDNSSLGSKNNITEKTVGVFNRIKRLTINLIVEEESRVNSVTFLENLLSTIAVDTGLKESKASIS